MRAIGRWSLTGLMLNSIIGSAIFGLPSTIALSLGRNSFWAMLIAGAINAVIVACYAEVASQFSEAGGAYLYGRVTFGRFCGIQTGWMLLLARIAGPAANANLFVTYVEEFWPKAAQPLPRLAILATVLGFLTLINIRGVRGGAYVSNLFILAKLVPLFFLAGVGGLYLLSGHGAPPTISTAASPQTWLKTILLLFFAYGGFENALTLLSEAKDPRRDVAAALFTTILICILLYAGIQWVVVGVLVDPAHSQRPLAEVARVIFGTHGASVISLVALISLYGGMSANILGVPRVPFALAEAGDFPSIFSTIHSKFRTPYFSILVFSLLTFLLAGLGSFAWNAPLSAIARLFYYAVGCAALPALRHKQPNAAYFRLPGGIVFSIVGIGCCLLLATQVDLSGSIVLGVTVVVGVINWIVVRSEKPFVRANREVLWQ